MPGPRKSSKNKSKPALRPIESTAPDTFIEDVINAEGWNVVVDILCGVFGIPDLTTRSGLKKVHNNFEKINKRLDATYKKNIGNEKIMGGIVGIYAKMCVDSILRNKIFKEDILSKLVPLLDFPSCRLLALRSLSTMTHHGGVEIRAEIARKTPRLLHLMQTYPSDQITAELCLTTLAHSVGAALNLPPPEKPSPKLVESLEIPLLLRLAVEQLQKSTPTRYLIDHTIELLSSITLHCSKECKDYPPVLDFFVGSLRSKDFTFRLTALTALIRLHYTEAEEDQRSQDPQKIIAAVKRGYPSHLSDILMAYGPDQCDMFKTLSATLENQKAFMRALQDKNICALGLSLADMILKTEFSVVNGMFQSENPRTGSIETMDPSMTGLPFTMWYDALPHCAKAIRANHFTVKNADDLADIVHLKYLIMTGRVGDAVKMAKQSIDRNPNVAYFYYVVTLGANATDGLRYAKQGMKCPNITPFVRFGLMHRAVEQAGSLGVDNLSQGQEGAASENPDFISALLMCALEDSKAYINEAPPDARHMKNVLYWYITLTLAVKGPEISKEMYELQSAFKKLQLADEFSVFIGITPPKTQMRLTQRTMVAHYATGIENWADTIARFDDLSNASPKKTSPSGSRPDDDLATWLGKMRVDTDDSEEKEEDMTSCVHPKISLNGVVLYRCFWCGNPSAVLRKCSRCSKARYCDANCQRAHYKTHKAACKAPAV